MINQTYDNLNFSNPKDRTGIIMLCDCIPDDLGDSKQKRAWALIKHYKSMFDIHLVMIARSSINLLHWRRLSKLSNNIELLPKISLSRKLQIKNYISNITQPITLIYTQSLNILSFEHKHMYAPIAYDSTFASSLYSRISHRYANTPNRCDLTLTSKSMTYKNTNGYQLAIDDSNCIAALENLRHSYLKAQPYIQNISLSTSPSQSPAYAKAA